MLPTQKHQAKFIRGHKQAVVAFGASAAHRLWKLRANWRPYTKSWSKPAEDARCQTAIPAASDNPPVTRAP